MGLFPCLIGTWLFAAALERRGSCYKALSIDAGLVDWGQKKPFNLQVDFSIYSEMHLTALDP